MSTQNINSSLKKSLSPRRSISFNTDKEKEKEERIPYLNIIEDLRNKSFSQNIKYIKTLKDYQNNFPKVKTYLSDIMGLKFASVFQFTFYNITSYLLFYEYWGIASFKQYGFVWII